MLDAKALHLAEKKKSASFKKKQVTWSHLKSPVASCHCFAPLTVALLQCLRCVWKCSVTKQCAFPAWLKLSIPADKPYNCEQRSAFPGSINCLLWKMAIALRILSIFLRWQNWTTRKTSTDKMWFRHRLRDANMGSSCTSFPLCGSPHIMDCERHEVV